MQPNTLTTAPASAAPTLSAHAPADVYAYTTHLAAQETALYLALALACIIIGGLLIEKRLLARAYDYSLRLLGVHPLPRAPVARRAHT